MSTYLVFKWYSLFILKIGIVLGVHSLYVALGKDHESDLQE